jgi:hypothetical protein
MCVLRGKIFSDLEDIKLSVETKSLTEIPVQDFKMCLNNIPSEGNIMQSWRKFILKISGGLLISAAVRINV